MDWPSQRLDLNPIENLRLVVKKNVNTRKPKNLVEAEKIVRVERSNISVDVCKNLVVNYRKRLEAVIKNKDFTTTGY